MTLHTGPDCAIGDNHGIFAGEVETPNCDVEAPNQLMNAGCSIKHPSKKSYGAGLNANKGGVYATQWTDDHISIWFFPRGEIPEDVLGKSPDPTAWGKPAAKFQGACDIAKNFQHQQLVFTNTFCGAWAGNVWSDGSCAKKAATCEEWVRDNPEAFKDAYWTINALKVYQDNGEAPAPEEPGYPVVSSSVELSSAIPTETAIPIPSEQPGPTATSTKLITVYPPVSSMTYAPFPTPINGTIPASAIAPPATFTTEYSVIPPSELLSSITDLPASSTLGAAPTPTGEAPEGPMDGFKWPGAEDKDVNSSPTASAVQTEQTFSILPITTASAVVESDPTETAAPELPLKSLPSDGKDAQGSMSGFQWPTGTGQNTPRNDTTTPPTATSTPELSFTPLPSEIPSETTDSAPEATATPPESPITSCTRTTMTMSTPCASSSTTVTEVLIPIPTGGGETVFETVYVTIDKAAAAAATETPARRKARMERFARKRLVMHHAR